MRIIKNCLNCEYGDKKQFNEWPCIRCKRLERGDGWKEKEQ